MGFLFFVLKNVSPLIYNKIMTHAQRDRGENVTKFQLQLLGYWDITPDFITEYESRFGKPYFA